jgi:hypothetical protein
MKYLDKYFLLFANPADFFKKVVKEKVWWPIILFVAALTFFGELLELALWLPSLYTYMGSGVGESELMFTLISTIAGVFISPVFAVLMSFLVAGVVHVGIRFFHGKGDYLATWKVVAYVSLISILYSLLVGSVQFVISFVNPDPQQSLLAAEPVMGVWWISMLFISIGVGVVSMLHVLYAAVLGLAQYHKIHKGHALIAIVLPVILLVIVIAFLVSLFVGGILAAVGLVA